ncbi:MAG: acyltransferase [Candidatus Eremiobacteraeota bacterium]|nr:acyltransferase [Candidatus Eremiobacteraeota bacterium]MBV8332148.1 acyltransferase [Candidatus Eremiobacteraeota bacterium]MBV8435224.1 acyltransferase [Candidatus Eremiobacteraeota bacterium]MBV8583610.1 acyltransferase [Candidatus Eremiobacteraeota bacterium]MBV8655814.1 acyltransferase [Candidatus Eremiobacteraeota bacterium]
MNPIRRIGIAWRALRNALRNAIADEAQREALAGVTFGSGVVIRGAERIVAGRGVFIDHRAYLNASTVNAGRGYIRIGSHVEIGPYCVLWGGGGIEIGSNVHMGAHVHVTSQQGRRVPPEQNDPSIPLPVDCAPVTIEDHVLLYSGVIVVPGVTIGHHAIVAAGSVVIDDIPPYATAAGAPARVVKRNAIA